MSDRGRDAVRLRSPRLPTSKFSIPRPANHLVHRSRLVDRLEDGASARLTLVVASAGAGKSILLADWLAAYPERCAAWLTCDSADADGVRFVAATIEALRRAAGRPDLGEDAWQLLSADGEVSADVVAALADDLERPGSPQRLVVDDFHLTAAAGAQALGLLLEYRPPSLQVVVATRVDPPFRLHRMRANQELVELRERDLSFSDDETRLFLSRFGLELDERNLGVVQERSEGWAAGLQMAALSIHRRTSPGSAAERIDLGRHTVAGYFLDEVLYRQPAPVVEFMLATSILDELSAPACAALSGEGSAGLLDQIFRDHLFVSLVDEEAGTYRYHQLIREVLRGELRARDPARERRLHERAARYLSEHGRTAAAARHLLDAGDPATAFQLLSDGVVIDLANNPQINSSLDGLQPDAFAGAPEILVPLATELLLRGAFELGARAFALTQATTIDADQHPELALRSATVSALYHGFTGQVERALADRDRALRISTRTVGSEDWLVGVDAIAMYAHLYLGNFTEALEFADAVATAEVTPPAGREVLCGGIRSQVAWAQGALSDAEDWATRALSSAAQLGFERHYFAFNSLRTRGLLALERHDLDAATERIEHILMTMAGGRPFFEFLAQLDRARIWAAAGNLDEALASLPAARDALRSDHSILLARADELQARIRLTLGDHTGAMRIAEDLPGDRRVVVSTMVALQSGDVSTAAEWARIPLQRPTIRSDLERQLLQADIALGERAHPAPRLVRSALDAAERHGFVQTVLDTAPHLIEHVLSESDRYPPTAHLAALVAAAIQTRQQAAAHPQRGQLADPLTDAEIKVLQKLPQRLTYADIAYDMHLSLNTVKTHLRHTYMKLGVSSRSAAVKRAAALGFV